MCNKGWDVKSYTAAQEEKDKQIELVLDKILVQLKQLQSTPIGLPRQCMADSAASGSSATGQWARFVERYVSVNIFSV